MVQSFWIVARLLLCGGQLGPWGAQLRNTGWTGEGDSVVCWNTFVYRVCAGESQEDHLSEVETRNSRIWKFDDSGTTMTMGQVVTEFQQEVFTLN